MPKHRKLRWLIGFLLVIGALGGIYGLDVYRNTHPEPEVARLFDLLGLKPGMTAAEIGAGEGRMTIDMARRLGPDGRVFSTDLGSEQVADIKNAVAKAGLQNVTAIEGASQSTNLPERCCDAIWMSKVYHHFTDPASMDASIVRALRPGGRLAVIEFAPSLRRFWLSLPEGVPPDRGGHGIPESVLVRELTAAGLRVEQAIDDWWIFPDSRYCVVFRKP